MNVDLDPLGSLYDLTYNLGVLNSTPKGGVYITLYHNPNILMLCALSGPPLQDG